jgi:hypothetical protein
MMKKLLLLLTFSLSYVLTSYAQQHDTITVQTFTYGSPQDAWFALPPDTTSYEKILMHYKLKCNPAQSPACGEWDYLTYTYLYDHTGVLDSTLYTAPSFSVGGASPDTFSFMNSQTYTYYPHFQDYIVYTDTTSLNTHNIGQALTSSTQTLNSANANSRSQYIWKAAELLSAGITAGNITALALQFDVPGSELKNFTIRIKETTLDSLTATEYENSGFQTVFLQNTTIASSGITTFNFTTPFNWDGTSNLVIDFSFSNTYSGTANSVFGESTGWYSGINSVGADNYLDFEGPDYIQVPAAAFAELDSFITIMFWQYGDPALQPQADMIFEGYNAQNERVLNVHLPWDNGNIYWDAGNASGFDRIELAAQPAQYEGQWNHWAFTKNAATGSMKIYLNGVLFHSGTGMVRPMTGVVNFKIGSAAPGNLNYDGYVDEFSFWNKELDITTIQEWMDKDVAGTHPDFNELSFYYPFNEPEGTIATDASGNGFDGELAGLPSRQAVKGWDIFRNLNETQQRPFVVLEQGVFQSHLDSILVIDTLATEMLQLLVYADSANPLVATDTLGVWEPQPINYVYDSGGNAIDSTIVAGEDSVFLSIWEYYGAAFEVIDRYEIGRFITPYGFGLDLHDGFTWVYDVSDFEPLLHDSVHLTGGNWQELLDIKFEYIVGTPAREVLSVENIWNGDFALSNFDTRVTEKTMLMNPAAAMYNLKTTASGHQFDNPSNCAEFCSRTHTIKVDGSTVRSFSLWKQCDSNPLYPQGGTWLLDRAAWCPGAPVDVYNTELTDLVTPGDSASIDYNIQSNAYGNYVFESQLISYGAANFTIDAAVDDIISPSNKDEHYRDNPICVGPKIVIKNNGTSALTSLTITYGVVGGTASTQNWTGNLGFLETEVVELGSLDWTGIAGGQGVFEVTLSNANGNEQYTANNTMRSTFTVPEVREYSFVVWTKTNASPFENSWTIKDESGTVLYSRNNMDANTTYKDTVNLPNGCFVMQLIDEGQDGMDWWAGEQGGYIRLKSATSNQTLENFDSKWTIAGSASQYRGDFGSGFKYHFTTGWALPVEENKIEPEVFVYPNPTQGLLTVDVLLTQNEKAQIEVFDITGQLIYNKQLSGSDFYSHTINLSATAKGVYVVNVRMENSVVTRKIIVQ